MQVMNEHEHDLRVDTGMLGAEMLHVNLMELPEAALLGPFPAEHGTHRIEFGHRFLEEAVLQIGADDGGRRFRSKR